MVIKSAVKRIIFLTELSEHTKEHCFRNFNHILSIHRLEIGKYTFN